jgi:hypothetical protein
MRPDVVYSQAAIIIDGGDYDRQSPPQKRTPSQVRARGRSAVCCLKRVRLLG